MKFVGGKEELWIPFGSIPQIDINADLEDSCEEHKGICFLLCLIQSQWSM